jgi:hypothetical protein
MKAIRKTILLLALTTLASITFAQTKRPVKKAVHPHPAPKPTPVITKHQDGSFSVKDKNFLDPGVGLGTYYKGLPFGVSFEHGFTDQISAGVFANYSSYNYSGFDYKLSIIYFGVRGSYHFAELFNVTNPRFDPYGGVSLGYYNVSFNGNEFGSPYSSSVLFGVHAGVRYMFSDKVGGFAEAGYGVSALQIGASFKF